VNAGHANFIVRVSRKQSENYKLPQISFEGEPSVINNITRYEYGAAIKRNCIIHSQEEIYDKIPNQVESEEIHKILLESSKQD
jgi:hypothetical protein